MFAGLKNNKYYHVVRDGVEFFTNTLSRMMFLWAAVYSGPLLFLPVILRIPTAILIGITQWFYGRILQEQLYGSSKKPVNKKVSSTTDGWQRLWRWALFIFALLIAGSVFFGKLVFFQSLLQVSSFASLMMVPCLVLAGFYALRMFMRHTFLIEPEASAPPQKLRGWHKSLHAVVLLIAPVFKELLDGYALFYMLSASLGFAPFWTWGFLAVASLSGSLREWYNGYYLYLERVGQSQEENPVLSVGLAVFATVLEGAEQLLAMQVAPVSAFFRSLFMFCSIGFTIFEVRKSVQIWQGHREVCALSHLPDTNSAERSKQPMKVIKAM